MIKNWEQFNESNSNKNHALLLRNQKRFWIGSANVLDGYIEEVHTYETAKGYDFHHSFYFSQAQQEKIKNEECVVFWVDEFGIEGIEWRHGRTPDKILKMIEDQIEII